MDDDAYDESRRILSCESIGSHICCNGQRAKSVRVRDTVTYIVGAILFDPSCEKIVMVQEAKRTCAGKWYYPAGRVEKNETLREAVRREVLEEAGLQFEPLAISKVEVGGDLAWYRFTFVGTYSGILKSTPDHESLAARFVDIRNELGRDASFRRSELRSGDFLQLIESARRYQLALNAVISGCSSSISSAPLMTLPVEVGLHPIVMRFFVVHFRENAFDLLLVRCPGESTDPTEISTNWHAPRIAIREPAVDWSLNLVIAQFERRMFANETDQATSQQQRRPGLVLRVAGVLNVQHSGKEGLDGLVLTFLLRAESCLPLIDPVVSSWRPIELTQVNSGADSRLDRTTLERIACFSDGTMLIPVRNSGDGE